jgi:predicted dehydrogenase
MEVPKVRVGMISYEHVHAEFRSRALSEMREAVEIIAVADDDEVRGKAAQQRYGGTYYRDYRQLLDRSDVDFVFIHSANNRHKRMVLDTIAAGKALFCEKPLATNRTDALEMTLAVERAGLSNTVGFCSRYIPEAERAKQLITEGWLGKIVNVQATIGLAGVKEIGCPDYMVEWMEDPERGGGGALIDEGAHAFDLLHWLIGDIAAVFAQAENRNKPELQVEDNATTLLRFKGGGLGALSTLWSLQVDIGMRNTLQIFGSDGTLFADLTSAAPRVSLYTERARDSRLNGWINPHIKPATNQPHDYRSWPAHVQHYKREVTDVVRRFQEKEPFQATFRDGLRVAAVTEAAYHSAQKNTFVSVNYGE